MIRGVLRGRDSNLGDVVVSTFERAPLFEEGARARLILHVRLVVTVKQPPLVLSALHLVKLGLDRASLGFDGGAPSCTYLRVSYGGQVIEGENPLP